MRASAVLFIAVFGGQLVAGYAGQLRRLYDPYQYTFLEHLLPLNRWTSWAAFALGAVQLLFVVNLVRTLGWGRAAEPNPWQVGTLELDGARRACRRWTTTRSSPVVVRGPYAPLTSEAHGAALGRDWIGRAEVLPGEVAPTVEGEAAQPGPVQSVGGTVLRPWRARSRGANGRGDGYWFGAVVALCAWGMLFAALAFSWATCGCETRGRCRACRRCRRFSRRCRWGCSGWRRCCCT